MISFVGYTHFSDFVVYYAQKNSIPAYRALVSFEVPIQTITTWEALISGADSESLFAESFDQNMDGSAHKTQSSVVDYSQLAVDKQVCDYLAQIQASQSLGKDVYLINRDEPSYTAAIKKTLSLSGCDIIELKAPDKNSLRSFLEQAVEYEQFDPSANVNMVFDKIVSNATSYDHIVSIVYLMRLVDQPGLLIKEYYQKPETALFMLPWRYDTFTTDALHWYKAVKHEDIQLALSLLMTKTLKWKQSKLQSEIISRIIDVDNQLKSFVRSDITQFHGLLWQLQAMTEK